MTDYSLDYKAGEQAAATGTVFTFTKDNAYYMYIITYVYGTFYNNRIF